MDSKKKALLVAELAREKKADDIVALDMRKLSSVSDYFIIGTANSTTQAQAIADNIEKALKKKKEPFYNIEGYKEAKWILIDAYDVVAHIFDRELRRFYNLEGLWGDAPRVKLCQKERKKKLKRPSKKR